MEQPHDLPLRELARRLRQGQVTARALAVEALSRQELGAYVTVDEGATLAQAEAADALISAGRDLGPLMGVPVSIKDLYGVPGYPTFAGSPKRLPERFERAGPVVRRALAQGAVVTGKTHTVEFAFGGVGTNPHHPTPRNPWDVEHHRAPGGSSAGAGVSLSEGSAHLAFGTDTAGSVRIPASWTGNVGLKTTKGRWSTEGIVPLSATLDTPGVLTRTVEDLITAFGALDPEGDAALETLLPADIRLGRCDELLFDDCSPGVAECVDSAIDELVGAGARLSRIALPELEPTRALFEKGGPVSTELYHFLSSALPDWLDGLDPNVRARVGDAGNLPAHEYLSRLATMKRLAAGVNERLQNVHVLVCPTVANTPPRLDRIGTPETYKPQNLLCLRNTCVVSYLHLCALTVPVGLDAQGMPVGLQLVAKAHDERRLLAVGQACEVALGTGRTRLTAPSP